jgi:Bacterial membrane protein YfhO
MRAGLLLAALLAVFFYDVVFLNRTLLTSLTQPGVMGSAPAYGYTGQAQGNPYLLDALASAAISEPAIHKESGFLRHLRLPLWDSDTSLGRPFLASADTTAASPLRLPVMLWPRPAVWDTFLLIRLLVAGMFTYLLARRLGLGDTAALGASVAFAFSGYFMLYVNHPHVDFAMMIPVLLYALELLLERASLGRVVFASASVALSTLANNPQAAVVVLLFGASYYMYRTFALRGDQAEDQSESRGRLLRLAAVMVAGLGLSAFALGPTLQLVGLPGGAGLSVSLHGPGSDRGIAHDPLRALISLFTPYFDGAPQRNFQSTGWSGIRNWAGVATPLLAILGLGHKPGMRKVGWFCAGAVVLLLAKTYGLPVVNLIGKLPALGAIDFPQYVAPAVSFGLAVLAGLGIQSVAEGRQLWSRSVAGAGLLVLLLGGLVVANRHLLGSIPKSNLAVQFGLAAIFLGLAVGVVAVRGGNRISARAASTALVGLVAVELFAFTVPVKGQLAGLVRPLYGSTRVAFVQRPRRYDPFTEPPYVRFLHRDTSEYRVLGLNFVLHPNSFMAVGLEDVRGLTATTVKRYWTYVSTFVHSQPRPRFTRASISDVAGSSSAGRPLAGNAMLDLLNVKYVLTPTDLPIDLTQRLPDGTPLSDQFRQVYTGEVNIYQNLDAFPRAFVVHHALAATGPDQSIALLKERGFDPRQTAVVEGSMTPDQARALSAPSGPDGSSARITSYSDNKIEIEATMDSPGLLVLSDTFYPGWRASVDGKKEAVHPTDEALRSIFLGTGTHRVTFTYSPTSFKAGSLITVLSVLGLAGYGMRLRRKESPGAATEDVTDRPGPESEPAPEAS